MFKFPWFKKDESIKITSIERLDIKEGALIIFTIPIALSEVAHKRLTEELMSEVAHKRLTEELMSEVAHKRLTEELNRYYKSGLIDADGHPIETPSRFW